MHDCAVFIHFLRSLNKIDIVKAQAIYQWMCTFDLVFLQMAIYAYIHTLNNI